MAVGFDEVSIESNVINLMKKEQNKVELTYLQKITSFQQDSALSMTNLIWRLSHYHIKSQ